jgi:anti-anti-sigma factor
VNEVSGLVQVVDRHEGAVPVCEIRGELDASNVDHVLEHVVGSVANEAPGMVLDLGHTSYLDSAGVRILFELARRLRARRQELRIAVPDDGIVRRVLVLTALADVVPLDDDVAGSVRALQTRT